MPEERKLQLKIRRSQKGGGTGLISTKPTFMLDARVELSPAGRLVGHSPNEIETCEALLKNLASLPADGPQQNGDNSPPSP